jgi:hypothetical protein
VVEGQRRLLAGRTASSAGLSGGRHCDRCEYLLSIVVDAVRMRCTKYWDAGLLKGVSSINGVSVGRFGALIKTTWNSNG